MNAQTNKRLNKTFFTGVLISFLFSAFIGAIHVGVLYLFGLPFLGLLFGIFLIWRGSASGRAKALVTFLCFPIICLTLFSSFYLNMAESETFLIPQNYRGPITVFLDEDCGSEPSWEDRRRVYNVSPTGVFITRFRKNNGYLDQKFFLVDDTGNRREIHKFNWQKFDTELAEWGQTEGRNSEPLAKDTVGIFYWYGAETYYTSKKSINLFVDGYKMFDVDEKTSWLERQKWVRSAIEQLEQCRGGRNRST